MAYGGVCGLKGSVMVPEGGDFLLSQVLAPKSALARLPGDSDAMLRVNAFDVRPPSCPALQELRYCGCRACCEVRVGVRGSSMSTRH